MQQSSTNGSAFELRGVSKHYQLGKTVIHALKNVDLRINGNQFAIIAGPSGSGKSTLLNIFGCLDAPTTGDVIIDNALVVQKLSKEKIQLRRNKIGFIFQSFNLIPVMTVYENVEYPLDLLNVAQRKKREMVAKALQDVGLYERRQHFPNQLSGGECQRVSIARALVKQPKLVLADEPTANLDSHTGSKLVELMREINRDEGVSFVFATHDTRLMREADTIFYLNDGQIGGGNAT